MNIFYIPTSYNVGINYNILSIIKKKQVASNLRVKFIVYNLRIKYRESCH